MTLEHTYIFGYKPHLGEYHAFTKVIHTDELIFPFLSNRLLVGKIQRYLEDLGTQRMFHTDY